MKIFAKKLLNIVCVICAVFGLNLYQDLYAQITFPNHSPAAASSIAVCSGEEAIVIDFTILNATSTGVEVKVKLADGIEYVPGGAAIVSTTPAANTLSLEENAADLNQPIIKLKSADGNDVIEAGTVVSLSLKRRATCKAWSNAIEQAGTGFTFKDNVTVTVNGQTTSKESNTYSVKFPNLSITKPAPLINQQLGGMITREFTITNGSINPTKTVYLSIDYGSPLYFSGPGEMQLQARIGTSGAYQTLTPSATNGNVRLYTLTGTTLGGDSQLTNGEIIYLKETFRLKTCAPSTVYKLGWGCSAENQCEVKTSTATITMAAGVANITDHKVVGPGYHSPTFSLCEPFTITFSCKNTGSGGNMGAAYDVRVIGKNDYYRPRSFEIHQFASIETSTGIQVPNTITNGSELDLRFQDYFKTDPDGPGGLDDVDGDGFYDDLPVGATLTLKYNIRLKCDEFPSCNNIKPLIDKGLVTKVLYHTACDKTIWIEPSRYYNTGTSHMNLTRELIVNASYIPMNIEKNKPFDMKIMVTFYNLASSYNLYGHNPNTRFVVEIDIPEGLNLPPNENIKWVKRNLKANPDGSYGYEPPVSIPAANIIRTANKIKIISPDNRFGYLTLKDVSYNCEQNSNMKISYNFREIFNYNIPSCVCPAGPIMCGTFSRRVIGCDPPCPVGPQTRIPLVEREDNSLGWTDYTMTMRQARNNISSYDLAKALYKDDIRLTASAVQHGSANSLGARFVLKLDRYKRASLAPLSADIKITRNGVQIVSITDYKVFNVKSVGLDQQIDWDFTSILPQGGLRDKDEINLVTHYSVISELGYTADLQMGKQWFFYNSDTSPVWNTAAPVTCLILVPEIYVMGTYPTVAGNPYHISGCDAVNLGGNTNNYARRFSPGAFKYENEYRPGVKMKNLYIKLPKSYTLNGVVYKNHMNTNIVGADVPYVPLTLESVTSQGEYNFYKYPFPKDHTAHFDITVENVYGAALKANVTATCAASAIPSAYDKVSYYVDYIDYYYYAFNQTSIPPNFDIVANFDSDVSQGLSLVNKDLIYGKKPAINLVNQSGEVELIGKTGEWKLRVNNPSVSTAPYVWLALPTTPGLTVKEVVTSAGVAVPFTEYSGGKMYRLSEDGIAAGTALDYTIKFSYTGCSPITLKAMGGWNCSSYPMSPADYVCNAQTVDLKLKPLVAAMELTEVKVPNANDATTLCNTLEYVYSIQSTDNASVFSPSFSIFPEEGLIVTPNEIKVEYPANSGAWQTIPVKNNKADLMQHTALAAIGYLKGLQEAGTNVNQRKIVVKFYVKTQCSFVSGKNFKVRADGLNACNLKAKGSGLAVSTPPINIEGAELPYSTAAATQLVTISLDPSDCKAPKRLKVVQTIVGGTTTANAYLEVTVPIGFKYVAGSYAPDNTQPGGVNAMPAGSETITTTSNGEDKIKIKVKSGLTDQTSFAYMLDIKENDDNPPLCGKHVIEIVNVEKIPGLMCEGVQCNETLVATGATKKEFELDKPYLDITVLSAISSFSGGKENLTIEYKVSNTSTTQPLKPGAVVTLFSDKDNNQVFSGGDVAVATQVLGAEITDTTPLTQTLKVKGVESSLTGNLVLTILPKDGCYCEIKSPMVTLTHLPSNYWIGGTVGKPNEWKEPNNWTNNSVPDAAEDVEFATEVNNPTDPNNPKSGPAKENLHLDDLSQNGTGGRVIGNLINDSDKDLVITTGNQLTINGVVSDNNSNAGTIVVKSAPGKPTGTLIFTNPGDNQNVGGTVEFYNQGYDCADCGMYRRSWQYFGIPVNESLFPYNDVLGNETVNQWVEPFNGDKWRPAPYAPDTKLQKFKGYQITNDVQAQPTGVYSFKGIICVCDAFLNLTRTPNVNYSGSNLVGNSYTAAIDIKQGIVFPPEVEQTVYLFNTGTRDQWRKLNGSTVSGYQAGQYLSVPKNTAGQNNLPDRIPSMHSFLLKMQNGASCTLQILYDKLLKNTTVNNGNGDQIAWRSGKSGSANMPSLVMDVLGNESADRLWIFTESGLTFGFDNGWDGRKLPEKGLSQLYALSDIGNDKFQVAAVPELNNQLIGFDADKDGQYTLEFALSEHFSKGAVYLHDLQTEAKHRITNSTSYSFAAKRGDSGARFRLSFDENGDDSEEMSVVVGTVGKRIVVTNNSAHDYTVHVYTADGKLLFRQEVKSSGKSMTEPLIDGAYVVSLQSPTTATDVRKVIVN
ncbi:T9SS type A sorting domain-containing protein [Porphyromonas gulae]|uniref:T9SS type A sorting domain-containing protein n=1 Tax=Porphyromonas gulae TaxID=111105 RepID=UPI000AD03764|nr:T9SS type A sorting domain-containing protein [Porphyromonas gulae]